ncbi:MAG: hypothetical protein CH6_4533 [Candidatus Kapaibacterium sp.]|nr:MAG: hypothetical protein CH6_4533 [Candidatus Kapabacteria bacterium]
MKHYHSNHHRRSIRLKDYDYSQAGAYFVTICTQNRECLFGNIENGKMVLNDAGKMIEKWYFELPNKFPDIHCDQYIIMPNHIHFIIINVGADLRVCPEKNGEQTNKGEHTGSPLHHTNITVGADLRVCPNKNGNINRGEHTGSPQHPTNNTVGADLRVCPNKIANINNGEQTNKGEHTGSPQHPTNNTVGADLRVCPNKIANINNGEQTNRGKHVGLPLHV